MSKCGLKFDAKTSCCLASLHSALFIIINFKFSWQCTMWMYELFLIAVLSPTQCRLQMESTVRALARLGLASGSYP